MPTRKNNQKQNRSKRTSNNAYNKEIKQQTTNLQLQKPTEEI